MVVSRATLTKALPVFTVSGTASNAPCFLWSWSMETGSVVAFITFCCWHQIWLVLSFLLAVAWPWGGRILIRPVIYRFSFDCHLSLLPHVYISLMWWFYQHCVPIRLTLLYRVLTACYLTFLVISPNYTSFMTITCRSSFTLVGSRFSWVTQKHLHLLLPAGGFNRYLLCKAT